MATTNQYKILYGIWHLACKSMATNRTASTAPHVLYHRAQNIFYGIYCACCPSSQGTEHVLLHLPRLASPTAPNMTYLETLFWNVPYLETLFWNETSFASAQRRHVRVLSGRQNCKDTCMPSPKQTCQRAQTDGIRDMYGPSLEHVWLLCCRTLA